MSVMRVVSHQTSLAPKSLSIYSSKPSKRPATKERFALDVASSEFYKDGKYDLDFKNPNSDSTKWISGKELADFYLGLIKKYPIVSVEDPFDQDDWEAWTHFTKESGIQIVGDDLTVTNPLRIKTAIEKKACNGLLLKVCLSCHLLLITHSAFITGEPDRHGVRIHPGVRPLVPQRSCRFWLLTMYPSWQCAALAD